MNNSCGPDESHFFSASAQEAGLLSAPEMIERLIESAILSSTGRKAGTLRYWSAAKYNRPSISSTAGSRGSS
jgi:hypothetical protein